MGARDWRLGARDWRSNACHLLPSAYCLLLLRSRKSRKRGPIHRGGVTDDMARRVWMHKLGLVGGLTKKYGVHRLVYC